MTQPSCGLGPQYLAGALDVTREAAFLDHLAHCARCQADVNDEVQLDAVEAEARAQVRNDVQPITRQRRRATRVALVVAPLLAAAAAVVFVMTRSPDPASRPAPPALALAEARSIEPRFTWAPADRHRPYVVARSGTSAAHETIAPDVLAKLERSGDARALATAWALAGDASRADRILSSLPASPEHDSDRAAVALLARQPELALELADRAVRSAPDRVQALWNRGLALRDLGMPLAAADDFARVAELDPTWREEATARANALRTATEERRTAWHAVTEAGFAMLEGGPILSAATARRFPGSARRFLYDAIRVAPSRERVVELAPLAAELDRIYGGATLAQHVERAAREDRRNRAAIAADYVRLARGKVPAAEQDKLLARLTPAGEDVAIGALVLARRGGAADGVFARWAARSADPWFELLALDAAAETALAAGNAALAETRWLEARTRCRGADATQSYRCSLVELGLSRLYAANHRHAEARDAARTAFELAARAGEWGQETRAQSHRANLEFFAERWVLARAFLREAALGAPNHCAVQRWTGWMNAQVLIFERRPEDAAAAARAAPTCDNPAWSDPEVSALVDLVRFGTPVKSRAEVQAIITARRAAATSAVERAWLDFAEGRVILDDDHVAGTALLERALAASRGVDDELARTVARQSITTLAVDAGRRGDHAALLRRLADNDASTSACVAAIAVDDDRVAVVVGGSDGTLHGHYERRRELDLDKLVPAASIATLRGCAVVHVLATPLVLGQPELLPADLPWSFRVSRGARNQASATRGPRLVVVDPQPPASLTLPALTAPVVEATATIVRGPEAHPTRVLLEMESASEIEIHAHGIVDLSRSSAPLLAMSPGPDGQWALTAEAVRSRTLRGAPIVALADCGVAVLSDHEAWGLPTAFLGAGARAVLASPSDIIDSDASTFFAAVLARIRNGEPPAAALAKERAHWLPRARWVRDVVMFE